MGIERRGRVRELGLFIDIKVGSQIGIPYSMGQAM